MKQFWRLTALQLKLTFGIATLKSTAQGQRKGEKKGDRFAFGAAAGRRRPAGGLHAAAELAV